MLFKCFYIVLGVSYKENIIGNEFTPFLNTYTVDVEPGASLAKVEYTNSDQ